VFRPIQNKSEDGQKRIVHCTRDNFYAWKYDPEEPETEGPEGEDV